MIHMPIMNIHHYVQSFLQYLKFFQIFLYYRMGKRSLRPRRNGDNGDSDTNAAAGRKRY